MPWREVCTQIGIIVKVPLGRLKEEVSVKLQDKTQTVQQKYSNRMVMSNLTRFPNLVDF